jgi:hypothetical protein
VEYHDESAINPPSIRLINSIEMGVSSASKNIVDEGGIPGVDSAINSPTRLRQNQSSKRQLSQLLMMTMIGGCTPEMSIFI